MSPPKQSFKPQGEGDPKTPKTSGDPKESSQQQQSGATISKSAAKR